uniref:6-methylsalicylic acid synthase (6-MSAS) ) n=1 Tax=Ganoderma boninense TaxID=34458 RepID=A0A5K1K5T4_9APHY|nr:6-methylsalicylic acid synthase (6-MSAS) (EC (Arthrosporol biosynthesis cluster protein AOL_s00215g283) [Ganoderma boninense]
MALRRRAIPAILSVLSLAASVLAIGQDTCVSFKSAPSTFTVVSSGKAAPIFLSPDEWPGVQRAAADFASDIQSVTGVKPTLANLTLSLAPSVTNSTSSGTLTPIIVGTLGKSSLIAEVLNHTKLDVSSIQGKWEAFMAKEVKNPLPGISSAYVVIGADKRGSIFALYDHSEQFGVSPWYWWADVPVTKHNALFVDSSGCAHGTPTVKYRGIFLNDEQPALQNWAAEKFTNGTGAALTGSPFNHFFYTKLFELILRLRGNYLWPDWYGIAMGTSHEEPMMRSVPVEWDLFGEGEWDYATNQQNVYDFWQVGAERAAPYEGVFTIGMRGNVPLAGGTQNIQLLEQIVSDQRGLLMQVFNTTDVTTIPQVWTLYKEVEGYYDEGMQVPDDVILLWSDDNWGKSLQSSQIEKTFEQMSTAVNRDATNLWILNVGDLKPYEMHIEFFLTYGYDASKWNPANLNTYVTSWAQREFDLSAADAAEVASIVHNVTRHNARRKPELVSSTTYSLVNYRECGGERAGDATGYKRCFDPAVQRLAVGAKGAFFQLVHHPIQATLTLQNMYYSAGLNNLRASQACLIANNYKTDVENLFDQDYALEVEYHSILNGII